MEAIWTTLKNINAAGIPLGKIATVVIILAVTQFLRVFLTSIVLKRIERFISKTENRFGILMASKISKVLILAKIL